MPHHTQIDIAALTPVERIALADVLYDSAMQEIDELQHRISPDELAEIDRRIAKLDAGEETLVPWDDVYARLTQDK